MGLFKSFRKASQDQAPAAPAMTSREANEMLIKACQKGDVATAEYALKASGSPNLCCDRGYHSGGYWQRSPVPMLWDAVNCNNPAMTQLLLKYGANLEQSHNGRTPLMLAVIEGRTPIVRSLLDAGASMDVYADWCNPLEMAKKMQYADVTRMLEAEPARRAEIAVAAQRAQAEAEAKRLADLAKAQKEELERAHRAANPPAETVQTIKVMKPLSLKGAAGAKKKWGIFS